MAAPISPAKKLANGKDSWWLVPTVDDTTAPSITEVNAATGLNLTGYLMGDYEGPSSETEKVTLPRVVLETEDTQVDGATTRTIPDMMLTVQPQAAAASDGKKAWELFDAGSGTYEGFLVRRQDVVGTTGDASVGEFLDVWPVSARRQDPTKTSTGADAVYVFRVSYSITNNTDVQFNVAAVA